MSKPTHNMSKPTPEDLEHEARQQYEEERNGYNPEEYISFEEWLDN